MQVKKMECYIQENYDKSKSYKNKVNLAKKVVKYLKQNNINETDLITYTTEQFEDLIKYIKPTSLIDVSDVIYRLNDILKYCFGNEYNDENLLDICKEPLWLSIKDENKMKRYFNESKYNYIVDYLSKNILYDDNDLYYLTLFMSIYEGMYNKGLTEIRNLRLSDINTETNVVVLKDDYGNVRELKISNELVNNLVNLSRKKIWYKKQGKNHKIIEQDLVGKYDDSIFKIVIRTDNNIEKSYKEFYYRRLKTIIQDFIGYNTTPLQIFVSGIINRVYRKLLDFNITYEEIKNDSNTFTVTSRFFIKKECERVGYNVNFNVFMRTLKSYAEIFEK